MIFGVVIILIGLEMLLKEFQTRKIKQSKIVLGIIGVLIGLALGMFSGKYLDEKVIKKVVIIMLIVSGIALILNNL